MQRVKKNKGGGWGGIKITAESKEEQGGGGGGGGIKITAESKEEQGAGGAEGDKDNYRDKE